MYTYNDPICKRTCSTVNSNPWDHVYYMSDQKENSSLCSLVYFRVFSLFGQLERTLLCEAVNQSTLLQTTALQSCISLKKSDGWIVNWLGTLHICIAPFAKGVWYEQKECPCPSPKLVSNTTDWFLSMQKNLYNCKWPVPLSSDNRTTRILSRPKLTWIASICHHGINWIFVITQYF